MHLYVLDDEGNPLPVDNPLIWAQWFETANRVVAKHLIDGVTVSTVFLGIDHNFFDQGSPILWETMIFGGPHDQYQERYSSREDALQGHTLAVAMVKNFPI